MSRSKLQVHIGIAGAFLTLLLGFFSAGVATAEAATLSVSPTTGVYTTGSPFTVRIIINTQGEAINAAEGTLSFNPQQMTVASINQGGSIFSLWAVEPSYSNSAGTISFGGGSPRGYTGSAGTIMSVTFVPRAAGTAKLTFSNGSVLAADGKGTNVLTAMNSGTYTLAAESTTPVPEEIEYIAPANTPAAPSVSSETHPDPAQWYTNTTAELSWSIPSGVTGVRTGLTNSPSSVPTVVYDTPISSRTLEDLAQGIQYFHIQFRNSDGWGRVTHYRLAVDSEKPTSFDISMLTPDVTGDPQPTLLFDVEDATSEVRKFIIQIDGGEAIEYIDETGSSTYTLPTLEPGRHSVVVEAFDMAGNSIVSSFAFDIASFEKPVFTDYPNRIATDVVPVMEGSTRPNSEVRIEVTRVGATTEPDVYTVQSNDGGVFTFIPDGSFEQGVYDIIARSTDEFGAQSDWSDPIRIVVAAPGYLQFGSFLISALSLIVPLVALLLLLILATLYFVRRIRVIGGYIIKETEEAETSVTNAFARLRSIVDTHAKALASSRKTKKLTQAESDLIQALRKELQESERRVKKEVGDVDDIV